MRTPDYYIPRSPREFLYVRTVIRQRYRTAIVLFLSRWYVRNWIEVLQWKKSSTEILHIPRIFSWWGNTVYVDIPFVSALKYFNRLLDISYLVFLGQWLRMFHQVTQGHWTPIIRTFGLQRILFHFVAKRMYRLSSEIFKYSHIIITICGSLRLNISVYSRQRGWFSRYPFLAGFHGEIASQIFPPA